MGDSVRSKPWLGLMGILSAIMSTLGAFGLAMYLDIEFIGINLAAPFLMIGEYDFWIFLFKNLIFFTWALPSIVKHSRFNVFKNLFKILYVYKS